MSGMEKTHLFYLIPKGYTPLKSMFHRGRIFPKASKTTHFLCKTVIVSKQRLAYLWGIQHISRVATTKSPFPMSGRGKQFISGVGLTLKDSHIIIVRGLSLYIFTNDHRISIHCFCLHFPPRSVYET